MHPSELKNCALVAASNAERYGFTATAEALLFLAEACAMEANGLKLSPLATDHEDRTMARIGRNARSAVAH
jgi:hypothetical protein